MVKYGRQHDWSGCRAHGAVGGQTDGDGLDEAGEGDSFGVVPAGVGSLSSSRPPGRVSAMAGGRVLGGGLGGDDQTRGGGRAGGGWCPTGGCFLGLSLVGLLRHASAWLCTHSMWGLLYL